jgi:UDP-2-acetamido-2,6-beta-L-arabino-hexul-4-ose reductase
MNKRVLITGSHGFIGRNLAVRLDSLPDFTVLKAHRTTSSEELSSLVRQCDVVVHLAGVNRPRENELFQHDNVDFTDHLLTTLTSENPVPVVFSSSIQAELDSHYGVSKRDAEALVHRYGSRTGQPVRILRLPNVFGKWCRPNYNSVVATFVHNVSRGLPLQVNDANRILDLAYIDDVVDLMILAIRGELSEDDPRPDSVHRISVGELAALVRSIHEARGTNSVLEVGTGLRRALYATYISALDPANFSYSLAPHIDPRGSFTEVLRTPSSGQMSFLTAVPGATRGSHFHHTKIEKFVVVSGQARFRFRCLLSGDNHEVGATAEKPMVVESIPGWVHDITNIGTTDLVVLIWANEVFDPAAPDTYPQEV